MSQVIFYHAFRLFARSHAKVTPRPEVTAPIALLQVREALEQFHRAPALGPPHGFARRQVRLRGHQGMDMVLADNALQDFDLKLSACLPDQLPDFQANVAFQYLVTVFRDKHKMVLNLKYRVAAITVIHKPFPFPVQGNIIRQKS